MKYEKMFTPIRIGNMEVKNRLVVAPMDLDLCDPDHKFNDDYIHYMALRARGGWGMLFTEGTVIDPLGFASSRMAGIYNDDFIPQLKKLTDEVHKYGAKLLIQIHHVGAKAFQSVIGEQAVSASSLRSDWTNEIPRELTTEEVYQLIEKFGDGAVRAKKAGADGVEVHGGHRYLVAQFMSPVYNKRVDEFGGNFENRMRFAVEIIKNIKKKAGNDFPVIFRMGDMEGRGGGRTVDESRMIARVIEDAGADAIDITTDRDEYHLCAPAAVPHGFILSNVEEIKKSVSVPIIGVGRIHDPMMVEDALLCGKTDMISMGRQSIADSEWPNKVAEGRLNEIAPCIGCLQGCVGYRHPADPDMTTSCMVNPFVTKERRMEILPAKESRKITVVGGGPGGLEAAWIAAKRGHQVTVYEKEDKVGGNLLVGGYPPGKQLIIQALTYFKSMCDKYGVTFRMNEEANEEKILADHPDAVILATGSKEIVPNIQGIHNDNVHTANNILLGKENLTENKSTFSAYDLLEGKKDSKGKVLIIGGGMVGCEVADFLGEFDYDITIVDMLDDVAKDVMDFVRYFLLKRLEDHNVKIKTNTKVKEIRPNSILAETNGKEVELEDFDHIVLAVGYKAYNPLEDDLKDKVETHVIGDAVKSRKAIDAIYEGARIGIQI